VFTAATRNQYFVAVVNPVTVCLVFVVASAELNSGGMFVPGPNCRM
jgi:hypothetical protein